MKISARENEPFHQTVCKGNTTIYSWDWNTKISCNSLNRSFLSQALPFLPRNSFESPSHNTSKCRNASRCNITKQFSDFILINITIYAKSKRGLNDKKRIWAWWFSFTFTKKCENCSILWTITIHIAPIKGIRLLRFIANASGILQDVEPFPPR